MGASAHASLKELGERAGIRIGAAVAAGPLRDDHAYREALTRECGILTPENAMKWGPLRPTTDVFAFEDADAIAAFARERDIRLRGHALVWHLMLPEWLERHAMPRAQTLDLLQEHIFNVTDRYRETVTAWDVVNEALAPEGGLRDGYWLRNAGPEYIALAFRWARESVPECKLFYNEYEFEGGGGPGRQVCDFVESLLARGTPLDGVGLQLHLTVEHPPDMRDVAAAVRRFTALGLDVHFTEVDVRCSLPVTPEILVRQAAIYADLLRVARDTGVTAFVMWGLTDRYSWVPGWIPGQGAALPLDENLRPKPAYDAMTAVLS